MVNYARLYKAVDRNQSSNTQEPDRPHNDHPSGILPLPLPQGKIRCAFKNITFQLFFFCSFTLSQVLNCVTGNGVSRCLYLGPHSLQEVN